ncbi:MAG: DUF4124 domain-containing protein [Gammaproteobacteria bacterium]|nr:DUF4124 domain-containing protein [Gammaproteobacteria bacterium]
MKPAKLAFLSLLLACTPVAADVYKSVDKNGNIIYSDTPSEDAEKIELEELPIIPALETGPASTQPSAQGPVATEYTELEIASPVNDVAVRFEEGESTIPVSVRLVPALSPSHVLVLYLDGNEYATGRTPGFRLNNVERGTHNLRVVVKTTDGKIVKSSPTSTFHLQMHSKLQPKPTVGTQPKKPK